MMKYEAFETFESSNPNGFAVAAVAVVDSVGGMSHISQMKPHMNDMMMRALVLFVGG